jgi:hypothetical protein
MGSKRQERKRTGKLEKKFFEVLAKRFGSSYIEHPLTDRHS